MVQLPRSSPCQAADRQSMCTGAVRRSGRRRRLFRLAGEYHHVTGGLDETDLGCPVRCCASRHYYPFAIELPFDCVEVIYFQIQRHSLRRRWESRFDGRCRCQVLRYAGNRLVHHLDTCIRQDDKRQASVVSRGIGHLDHCLQADLSPEIQDRLDALDDDDGCESADSGDEFHEKCPEGDRRESRANLQSADESVLKKSGAGALTGGPLGRGESAQFAALADKMRLVAEAHLVGQHGPVVNAARMQSQNRAESSQPPVTHGRHPDSVEKAALEGALTQPDAASDVSYGPELTTFGVGPIAEYSMDSGIGLGPAAYMGAASAD